MQEKYMAVAPSSRKHRKPFSLHSQYSTALKRVGIERGLCIVLCLKAGRASLSCLFPLVALLLAVVEVGLRSRRRDARNHHWVTGRPGAFWADQTHAVS